ncbi:MAG: hypothetical protein DCC68_11060 [Planctomycetota bacterium]|nr:MAG: hypothetical protein DCC68_11060 [Planctomycetota bacterium]
MTTRRRLGYLAAAGICSLIGIGGTAIAQRYAAEGESAQGELARDRLREPVYRPGQTGTPTAQAETQPTRLDPPAERAESPAAPPRYDAAITPAQAAQPAPAQAGPPAVPAQAVAAAVEHPLTPVLKLAHEGLDRMDRTIADYECLMVKRERIDGKLGEHQYVHAKVRNKPFSIYMYFLAPDAVKGREAIYVDGQNDGKLIGHDSGFKGRLLKRVYLDPTSPLVMANQRYPITKAGIRNLTQELVTVGEHDKQFGECDVKFFKGAKVQDRVCTCIQVVHPVPRKNFRFHLARIYIDDEHQIPIRYESYDWPQKEGGQPVLLEEYTYTKLKLNVGLKDSDFDPDNPNYNFQ